MPTPAKEDWVQVKNLYLSGASMKAVAAQMNVSIHAITYALRRMNVPRRDFKTASRLAYEAKEPTFRIRSPNRKDGTGLHAAGAMLYWAEGYKRETAGGIDFANSDPDMIKLFVNFLRNRYKLDAQRLHFSVYYYADQDLEQLLEFWSKLLRAPLKQFKNHYRKPNPRPTARKLPYGVLHVRYNDKKLLRDMLTLIESCKRKYLLR